MAKIILIVLMASYDLIGSGLWVECFKSVNISWLA